MTGKQDPRDEFIQRFAKRDKVMKDLLVMIEDLKGRKLLENVRNTLWQTGRILSFQNGYRHPYSEPYLAGGLMLCEDWPVHIKGYQRRLSKDGRLDEEEDRASQVKKHQEELRILACLPLHDWRGKPGIVVSPNTELGRDFKEVLLITDDPDEKRAFLQTELERYRAWRMTKLFPPPFDLEALKEEVVFKISQFGADIVPLEYEYLWTRATHKVRPRVDL